MINFIKENAMLACVLVMVGLAGVGLVGALGYIAVGFAKVKGWL